MDHDMVLVAASMKPDVLLLKPIVCDLGHTCAGTSAQASHRRLPRAPTPTGLSVAG